MKENFWDTGRAEWIVLPFIVVVGFGLSTGTVMMVATGICLAIYGFNEQCDGAAIVAAWWGINVCLLLLAALIHKLSDPKPPKPQETNLEASSPETPTDAIL